MSTFVDSKFLVCGGSTELTNAPNNTCDMFSLETMAWGSVEDMTEYRHQVRHRGVNKSKVTDDGLQIQPTLSQTRDGKSDLILHALHWTGAMQYFAVL